MAYDYIHLENNNVGGGLSDLFAFAPVRWFDTIERPTLPFNNPGDSVTISNAHTFLDPQKGFIKGYSSPFKNKFMAKGVGEVGSKKFEENAECFIPGSDPVKHEQLSNLMNEPLIALFRDASCEMGMNYQLGSDCVFAYIDTIEFSTGTIDGQEVNGYKVTFKTYSSKVYVYKGAIQYKP